MSESFAISDSDAKFPQIMETIKDKMKDIFSQTYDEDLYSFVHQLLTKSTTKETVQNELVEVFGSESPKLQIFLDWLWTFLQSQGIFSHSKEKKPQTAEPPQQESKTDKPPQKINLKKPVVLQKEQKERQNPKPTPNNNLKSKNNNNDNDKHDHDEEKQPEQPHKDKKSILERIKKPKAIPRPINPPRELKRNLAKVNNNNEIKEKVIEKKVKTEVFPPKNLVAEANNNEMEVNEETVEENQTTKETTTIKKRCRDWPSCKNEACKFHHPTEQCKKFPKCSFGNQCLYIHPLIECKFGAFCQRPNCAYMHPKMPSFQPPMFKKPFPKDKKPNPALNKKNVTLNTTNEIKMKSNEESGVWEEQE